MQNNLERSYFFDKAFTDRLSHGNRPDEPVFQALLDNIVFYSDKNILNVNDQEIDKLSAPTMNLFRTNVINPADPSLLGINQFRIPEDGDPIEPSDISNRVVIINRSQYTGNIFLDTETFLDGTSDLIIQPYQWLEFVKINLNTWAYR